MEGIKAGDHVQISGVWPKKAKGTVKHFTQPEESLAWVQFDRPHSWHQISYDGNWYRRENLQKLEKKG